MRSAPPPRRSAGLHAAFTRRYWRRPGYKQPWSPWSTARRSKCAPTSRSGPSPRRPQATAYSVVAEALTNAVKHAGDCDVVVAARTIDGRLRVVVTDDGTGGADRDSGSGLAGLADRVHATGGTLKVVSPQGGGTRVEVNLPCA